MGIQYVTGDATEPQRSLGEWEWPAILHVVNDIGAWGSGFVVPLGDKYPEAKETYLATAKRDLHLGHIQKVNVKREGEPTTIINMIAQHGVRGARYGNRPLRYDALAECLSKVAFESFRSDTLYDVSFHLPRIGCGLAGGDWAVVSALIEDTLCVVCKTVKVYDLP